MAVKFKHPVSTNHPDYDGSCRKWQRCRDACAGSDAIKAATTKYLPALELHKRGMEGNAKYEAYLGRALWYNASRRTRIGLSGAATLKTPKFTSTNVDQLALVKQQINPLVDQQIEVARALFLVNQKDGETASLTLWKAEAIVNWKWALINGKWVMTLLVLEDEEAVPAGLDDAGVFEHKTKTVRHAYRMVEGVCEYSLYEEVKDEWMQSKEWTPLAAIGNRPLDHIPALMINATETNCPVVEDPVILDLVDVNISHYKNSADLEHGMHWTSLPTAVAVGFPTRNEMGEEIEFNVGGEAAWVTDATGAQAFYLEFSGSGLNSIRTSMQDKQSQMAVLGARLLEEAKPSVEAAETIKSRMTGDKSVLSRITIATSEACTWALRELLWFDKIGYEAAEGEDMVELNSDFVGKLLSPAELTALIAAMQGNAISYETLFGILQQAEIIPAERTLEEERTAIDAGPPGPETTAPFDGGGGFGGGGASRFAGAGGGRFG